MKILHVYKSFLPETFGGIPETIKNLIVVGKTFGTEGSVFTFSAEKTELVDIHSFDVTRAKTDFEILSTPFSISSFGLFNRLVKNFDVIHFHYPFPFGDLLHLISNRKIPSLVTYHSDIIQQKYAKYFYYPVEQSFLNSMHKIVCTSCQYAKTSFNLKKFDEKVVTIPIGLKDFAPQSNALENCEYWNKILPNKYILFLGVLRQYKGIETLLQAAEGGNFNVVIAGAGDGLEKFKMHAKKKKLTNVIFFGQYSQSDKVALLSRCSAVVLPSTSRNEAFGLSLVEGAMFSKPLISSELHSGTSFVNSNGKTGFVISPNNTEELKSNMAKLFHDEDLSRQMGKNARERYERLFTAQRMCESYKKTYAEIIN